MEEGVALWVWLICSIYGYDNVDDESKRSAMVFPVLVVFIVHGRSMGLNCQRSNTKETCYVSVRIKRGA